MTYKLDLPSKLGAVHLVFYVSMLQKCIGDSLCITQTEDIHTNKDLFYDEVSIAISDQQVRKLRTKEVAPVKVL